MATATVRTGTKTINLASKAWFGPMDRDGPPQLDAQPRSSDTCLRRPPGYWYLQHLVGVDALYGHHESAEHVKRGVYEMGGFPVEFPVMSGETLMRPTTMLFRNLASMDVEESIHANPMDGVVR